MITGVGYKPNTTTARTVTVKANEVNGSTLTVAGVVDITEATDASDATGDTGALRTEGGASIAKKLYNPSIMQLYHRTRM